MDTPTPNQTPAPPSDSMAPKKSDSCPPGGCKDCLQPPKKELSAFLFLVFLIVSLVLGVLLIQAKRELLSSDRTSVADSAVSAAPTPYPLAKERTYTTTVALPAPRVTGALSLETAIATRRSRRVFAEQNVTLQELGQVLWSGQGITDPATGKRAAPSARESYPMTLFVVAKRVQGLEPGLYEYIPKTHALGTIKLGSQDEALKASGVQEGAQTAPVVILVGAAIGNYQAKTKSTTTTATYMEAGHIGQNMYLQTESLKMATVVMAGFDSKKVTAALGIDPAETIEYVIPFGHIGVEAVASPSAAPTKEQ